MLLCIDVGNTNVTLGLYTETKLLAHWRLATDHERMSDEFAMQLIALLNYSDFSIKQIQGVAMASVVPPLTGRWVEVCRTYLHCEPLVVDGTTTTGLQNLYDNPQAVGADRIVNAVAAYHVYGGPACIVDFGTATTFDALSGDGAYLGGAIAPGIGISADALFQRAAKLPKVDLARPPSAMKQAS